MKNKRLQIVELDKLVALPFLFGENRKVTAASFAISIFVPFCDGLIIVNPSGFAPPLLIHSGRAFYMMVVTYFLLRAREYVQ